MSLSRAITSDGVRVISPWSGAGFVQFADDRPIPLSYRGTAFCGQYLDAEVQADGDHWAVVMPNADTLPYGFLIKRKARSVDPVCVWRPLGQHGIRVNRFGEIGIVGPKERDLWTLRTPDGKLHPKATPPSVGDSHSGFANFERDDIAFCGNGTMSASKPFGNPLIGGRRTRFWRRSGQWLWATDPEHHDQIIATDGQRAYLVSTVKSPIAPSGRQQADGSLIVAINMVDSDPTRFIHSRDFRPLSVPLPEPPDDDYEDDDLMTEAQLQRVLKAIAESEKRVIAAFKATPAPVPQPDPEPEPEPEPPSNEAPVIDLDAVRWLHHDVRAWPETSTITRVTIEQRADDGDTSYDGDNFKVCFPHTKAGQWPVLVGRTGTLYEANVWVFGFVSGQWHAATAEWVKPGATCKRFSNRPESDSWGIGPHTKEEPLETWGPKSGEWIGIMVSTPARPGEPIAEKKERSQVYMVRWP